MHSPLRCATVRPSAFIRRCCRLRRRGVQVLLGAAGLAVTLGSAAQAVEPDNGTFSFVLENDLFAGFDRDYTNGIRLSWTSGLDDVPIWALQAARILPMFPTAGTVRASYTLGQSIYTPGDITLEDPPRDDRPYAGWLYGAIGLMAETGSRLDQLQVQLGVVGPWSFADETQTLVHEIVGADKPEGWSHQIKNEPGIIISYERSWRALAAASEGGVGFDVTPHVGGALGNVMTYGNLGATLRVGYNMPNDYGPPRIEPSLPGTGYFERQEEFGWYLFAGLDGRAVARNIFLDGNTFRDSRSVDKNIFVGDVQVGIAFALGSTRIAYTHVFRTPEFDGQKNADKFGALGVSVQF